jgi:hypothetical protein
MEQSRHVGRCHSFQVTRGEPLNEIALAQRRLQAARRDDGLDIGIEANGSLGPHCVKGRFGGPVGNTFRYPSDRAFQPTLDQRLLVIVDEAETQKRGGDVTIFARILPLYRLRRQSQPECTMCRRLAGTS